MALQSRVMHIPAGAGIDQITRPEHLQAGAALLRAENVRQDKPGSLSKRNGFTALTLSRLSGSRSAGYRHFAYGDQICVVDGGELDAYSYEATANVTKDRVPEAMPKRVVLPYPGATPQVLDVAFANDFFVVATLGINAAVTATVLTVSVVDATTYAVVRHDVLYTGLSISAITLKLAARGNTVVLVYTNAANTLHGRTLDVTSSSTINTGWTVQTSLCTDWSPTNSTVDLHALEDRVALAYANTSGGASQLSVRTFNTSLVQQEVTTINTGAGAPLTCGLAGTNADTLWVGWAETTNARVCGLTGNNLAVVKATTATVITAGANVNKIGIVTTGTGTGRLVVSTNTAGAVTLETRAFITDAGAVTTSGSTKTWRRLVLVTRPFNVGSRYYCAVIPRIPASGNENAQKCHFVVDLDAEDAIRTVANVSARQSILDMGSGHAPAHYASVSATRIAIVNVTQRSYLSISTGAALELAILDFASSRRWQSVEFADAAVMAGGVVSAFDGQIVDECNFLLRPDTPTVALGGGTGVTATAIKYMTIFEKTDGSGNVAWSAPSDVSGAVSPANQSVDVTLYPLTTTTHNDAGNPGNKVRQVVYRSGSNGALPYRRVGSVENDPTVATQTYSDTTSSVASNNQSYTPPGGPAALLGAEQVHQCPPAMSILTVYNDMLVGVADDGVTLWYSATRVIGEQPWFNDTFQLPLVEGGEITGLAAMDGTLFAFKRDRVYALQGVAPSGNGAQGGFSDPRRLAAPVGCIDPRSIVSTGDGIFFQAPDKAIWILTRNQTAEPVGSPVSPTTDAYPVCTSATLDAVAGLVYFELAASESAHQVSGNGRTLVFDLTIKKWVSVDRRKNNAGTADTPAQSGAIVYDGSAYRYSWLGTDGRVYVEDTSTALDVGAFVTSLWEVPRFRLGLQQQMRFWEATLLAEQSSAAGLLVERCYDAADYSASDNATWTESAALSKTQFPLRPKSEKFAVGFRVSDTAPATLGTGRGFTFVGISADLAPKQGSTKGTPHGDVTMRR